jgi:hypothetical protein
LAWFFAAPGQGNQEVLVNQGKVVPESAPHVLRALTDLLTFGRVEIYGFR